MINYLEKKLHLLIPLALYIWGEPLLNKNLSEIIRICKIPYLTEISINLNFPKYLEEVIDAEPEQIVLPCAGTGD